MTAKDENLPDSGTMSVFAHLDELRRRIVYALIVLFVGTLICFEFAPQIFEWLQMPLLGASQKKMVVLTPLEMFVTYLKLAFLAAVFLSSPWILLQIWLFVSPGLYKREKRWVAPFVIFGTLFFVSGGLFAFYVVLPLGFKYLVSMLPTTVEAQYSVSSYFSLVTQLMIAFGVVFELPLIMWILAIVGIVQAQSYSRFRKYWIVIAFVIAAILTPPDPFTQTLMAIPLLAFFELGYVGALFLQRKQVQTTS